MKPVTSGQAGQHLLRLCLSSENLENVDFGGKILSQHAALRAHCGAGKPDHLVVRVVGPGVKWPAF